MNLSLPLDIVILLKKNQTFLNLNLQIFQFFHLGFLLNLFKVLYFALSLKGVPCFAPCEPRAQDRLKKPRQGQAKSTTRGMRFGHLDAIHALCAQCTSLLGQVINLCLFVRKRNKTRNPNLLEYEVQKIVASLRKTKGTRRRK